MAIKRTGADKSRECLRIQIGEIYREIDRGQYLVNKARIQGTQEYQDDSYVREIVQETTKREENLYKEYKSIMEDLRIKTFETIELFLSRYDESVSDLPNVVIGEVLKKVTFQLMKLEKMCESEHYVERLNPLHPNEYEKLFINLISKVDVRFALFAPKRSLAKISLRFDKLPDNLKDEMFARLEKFGLMDDEKYREAYENVFKDQLAEKGYVF